MNDETNNPSEKNVASWYIDPKTMKTVFSEACGKLYEFHQLEMTPLQFVNICKKRFHPLDQGIVRRRRRSIKFFMALVKLRIVPSPSEFKTEIWRWRKLDGTYRIIESQGHNYKFDENGKLCRIEGVVKDVTYRYQNLIDEAMEYDLKHKKNSLLSKIKALFSYTNPISPLSSPKKTEKK